MENDLNIDSQKIDYSCLTNRALSELNKFNFSVYVIDYDWVYLFVNEYAQKRLGNVSITGKHIQEVWQEFPNFNFQPLYSLLKPSVDARQQILLKSTSPISQKPIEIKGIPLYDCYYFSVSEFPDKETLISELKALLKK
jgi:hypothetical protein